jgi:polyhydroxyalkanoate synthase
LFLEMLRSETANSHERQAAALVGLSAYQQAPRPKGMPPLPARFRRGRARLRDAGGTGRPVVLIPSLINPPSVLDLASDRSLVRWLAGQGCHAWLLDWGAPTPAERDLDLAGHVEQLLLPLLTKLDEPPVLVGYCLGGTLAMAAAAAAGAAGCAMIAAPWHFSGYGDARTAMAQHWATAKPACEMLGLLPMEVLQSGFWRLDPGRTISKFEAFGRMDPTSEAAQSFVRLEDWANAGAPLTLAAGRDLFERLVQRDEPGAGAWQVAGQRVCPATLPCPAIEFVSLTDRIVPAATAAGLRERHDIGAGHVGMMIGSRARQQLWDPLASWIHRACTSACS